MLRNRLLLLAHRVCDAHSFPEVGMTVFAQSLSSLGVCEGQAVKTNVSVATL